ncbi:uncharacterized protein LOC111620928 [Centruroides sculpturatus]|uniref:uncharacterized protein LOC111620928 n=1 Tax=Centruroides sculpturatus TaxID=218467 RepID=UPI000C6EE784|nr:uncharacterized protein LOC111620928 [Centruroides sculpturatus]
MWKLHFISILLLSMSWDIIASPQKSFERGKRTGQQFPTSNTGQPGIVVTNGKAGVATFPVQTITSVGVGRPGKPPVGFPQPVGTAIDLLPLQPTKGMAQIVSIDVQCQKQSMNVRIEFDQNFDGTIYSKNYFSELGCRYVAPNSHLNVYEFTISLDRCGTAFIDEFAQGGQAYLENTIIIQNHAGFQEVWDTARKIRCLWAGQFDKTVSSVVNVDMLDIVTITYSGDTVESYMDIQIGRGPFSTPVTGLVKIGETLTMVIYVQGADDFDIHVKDCIAHDGDVRNAIQLTDARGCVIKKKLMGPWQKSRQTGNTGASIIAFSFFQAFKFPDKMEVFLECNIEICKFQCSNFCPEYPNDPRITSGRKKREAKRNNYHEHKDGILRAPELIEPVRVLRGFRVVSPDDITISRDANATVTLTSKSVSRNNGDVCMSTPSFITALIVVLAIIIITCLITAMLCIRMRKATASPASSMLSGYNHKDILCNKR